MSTRRPPLGLLFPAAAAIAFVVLPLVGLFQRAPWSRFSDVLFTGDVGTALRLSLECSAGALALSLLLGVPLAVILARLDVPGRQLIRALITLPMVLPPVVGGVALFDAFGRAGFAGSLLGRVGVQLPFSTAGAVLAEAFVAMPFLVLTLEAGIRQADPGYEEVAATLGAGPWRRFWRVTLPLVAPSLTAGAALCWARALGEFGATITFAGNFPGRTQTMPLAVYIALESDPDVAVMLSLVLLVISVAVLVLLRDRWLGTLR